MAGHGQAICLAGLQFSAKEEASQIARHAKVDVFRTGDVVRENATTEFGKLTFGTKMRYLRDRVCPHLLVPIEPLLAGPLRSAPVVVDSIKSQIQITALRNAGYTVVTVALWAPRTVRFSRMSQRVRDDDPGNPQEFDARDDLEMQMGLGSVIVFSDFLIDASSQVSAAKTFKAVLAEVLSK